MFQHLLNTDLFFITSPGYSLLNNPIVSMIIDTREGKYLKSEHFDFFSWRPALKIFCFIFRRRTWLWQGWQSCRCGTRWWTSRCHFTMTHAPWLSICRHPASHTSSNHSNPTSGCASVSWVTFSRKVVFKIKIEEKVGKNTIKTQNPERNVRDLRILPYPLKL